MKKENIRTVKYALTAVALTAVLSLCAFLLVRNLGGLVRLATGDGGGLAGIFAQLKQAAVRPPALIPLAVWLMFFALCLQRKWKKSTVCIVSAVLWLVLFVFTLWFTGVNGIRFGSVVKSLLGYISNGLLEQL